MTRQQRIILIAAAGIVLAGVLIVGGVLIGRGGKPSATGSPAPSTPAGTTSPTMPPPTQTTPPITLPTVSSSLAASGNVVTPSGQILHSVSGPPVAPLPPGTSCNALIEPGWNGICGITNMAGGKVIWVTEHKPVPGSCCEARRATIYLYSADAGGWFPSLQAEDLDGSTYAGAEVRTADLTGDSSPEIVVGFRYLGSGSILGYDIVTFGPGSVPTVAAHPSEASHGSAVVTTGQVDEYVAQYPNNEPNCCPPFFRHRRIKWDGAVFRATIVGNVNPGEVPPSDF